jgi:phospholipid-translocating ATPase
MTEEQPPRRSLSQRFRDFDLAKAFTPAPPPPRPRSVYVNTDVPEGQFTTRRGKRKYAREYRYATNQVVTSKYTVLTFLPRNLLEQFRRIANMCVFLLFDSVAYSASFFLSFFAFIVILQFFPKFATISPGLVIIPLLVVLLITALKDGYEDVKRHQSDRRVNHSKVLVLEGGGWHNPNGMDKKSKTFTRGIRIPYRKRAKSDVKSDETLMEKPTQLEEELVDVNTSEAHWRTTAWEDVRVGDFVKLHTDESFPGDIIICATSEPEDVAFVETKNLDGETNLKSRHAVPILTHLRSAAECTQGGRYRLDADKPEVNMYRLNAKVTKLNDSGEEESRPESIDVSMMLLRGTVLRNTRWVIGIVLFTGQDTKIVLNSGGTPSKRSRVERQMNPMVYVGLPFEKKHC